MCGLIEALVVSTIASTATSLATQPKMPDIPKPELPSMAPGVAEREANKRRASTRREGRGSTILSGTPLGIQKPANTSAKYLTGE